MAEALLRSAAGDRFEIASAGTERRGVHPLAVRVMQEVGLDISNQSSQINKPLVRLRDWEKVHPTF